MTGEDLCYGFEGGYEDWSAERVVRNMRVMQDGKKTGAVEHVDEEISEGVDEDG